MSAHLELWLPGPIPVQGSFRAITSRSTGRAMLKPSGGERNAEFRHEVAVAVARELPGHEPLTTPMSVSVAVHLTRPKGHYGTGRNADRLKPSAPERPTSKPDLDKVARACLDALTRAGFWKDDAQVVSLRVGKLYAEIAGVEIRVREALS